MDTASPPPNRYRTERYRAMRKRQADQPLDYAPARDLLACLGRYGYLTVPQFLRLLYSPASRTHVNTPRHGLVGAGGSCSWPKRSGSQWQIPRRIAVSSLAIRPSI